MEKENFVPPESVELLYPALAGNQFAGTNKDTAKPQRKENLPIGPCDVNVYSLATPNGQRVTIMAEELTELVPNFQYNAHLIMIAGSEPQQFTTGFHSVNPNMKIPAAFIRDPKDKEKVFRVFESCAILLVLAEMYDCLLPKDLAKRAECLSWVSFASGSQGPIFGNFGHFHNYAPKTKHETLSYGIARYGMEVRRVLDVMDIHLLNKKYFLGDEYSIADIALFPWVETIETGYRAGKFIGLTLGRWKNLDAWRDRMKSRKAVLRGQRVCTISFKATQELVQMNQELSKL